MIRMKASICLAWCVVMPLAIADSIPKSRMTQAEATAYLEDMGLSALPGNIPSPVMSGDARTVEALIAVGLDPDANGVIPQSALELAAMSCSGGQVEESKILETMDVLIAGKANANAPGNGGMTALIVAAQQCKPAVVKRLIAAGAKLDARTPQGFTPLSMALIVSNLDAAETLIDAGATLSADAAKKLKDGVTDPRQLALIQRATAK